jgi:hypothetical protein
MLTPGEKKALREMLDEVRAMSSAEASLMLSSGEGRIPEKCMAHLNIAILLSIGAQLEQLIRLNEGEFSRFVEMWPRLWGRLFKADPPFEGPWAEEEDPSLSGFLVVTAHGSPFANAIRWMDDLMVRELLRSYPALNKRAEEGTLWEGEK